MPDERYEINHNGEIVVGHHALCADQSRTLVDLFSQYNHRCVELDHSGAYRRFEITDVNGSAQILHVYSGTVRNESRNPYEKKTQLGGTADPKSTDKHNTVIIGIYVYQANDSIQDAIFVGYPIDDNIRYDTNPSLRGVYVNQLLIQAKTKGFVYDAERNTAAFRSEFIFYYLDNHYSLHYEGHVTPELDASVNNAPNDATNKIAENILFYGVPGCGKSKTIKEQYCSNPDYYERTVFHPDYTYSDFVGQILPKIDGEKIRYEFVPGPFTNILIKAYADKNPNSKYYLIIEELNRGNAPAIFGDIFQLLDRKKDGTSEYEITNENIAERLPGKVKTDKFGLPANLFILATMNTADQNVFTLDTAFKRRWHMENIRSDFGKCSFANDPICGTNVTWEKFVNIINYYIVEDSKDSLSSEDHRLGAWFIEAEDLKDKSRFAEKVLMYLWNDAFRFSRDTTFNPEYGNLDSLIDGFRNNGLSVFADKFGFSTISAQDNESANNSRPAEDYLEDKKEELVTLYRNLIDLVKENIPTLSVASPPKLGYIYLSSPDIARKGFADITINQSSVWISVEPPESGSELENLGKTSGNVGHENHLFKAKVDPSDLSSYVELIIESYKRLKNGN